MRSYPFSFLLGFAAAYLPILYLLVNFTPAVPAATRKEPEQIVVVLETIPPEQEDDNQVLAASEPTEPTPSADFVREDASAGAAETSVPTPSEASSTTVDVGEVGPTPTPDVWAPPEYEPWFAQYAGQYGVDKNMLERLANCESHFNVNAQNGANVGMFQFTPGTWDKYRKLMGLDPNPDLRVNAEESIKTAAFLLQQRGPAPWPSCLR